MAPPDDHQLAAGGAGSAQVPRGQAARVRGGRASCSRSLISVAIGVDRHAILEVRDLPTPELGELLEQFARNAGVAALLGALGRRHRRPDPQPADRDRRRPDHGLRRRPALGLLAPDVERFSPTGALPTPPGPRSRRRRDAGRRSPRRRARAGLELVWIAVLFAAAPRCCAPATWSSLALCKPARRRGRRRRTMAIELTEEKQRR